MHAIILAAGRGRRLAGQISDGLPKCLLEFGGKSLLRRHLELLWRGGVSQVDLVVGYEADAIIEHVGRLSERPAAAFHFNPRFEEGSVVSLLAGRETLESGSDVVLMDADVLYHPVILTRLLRSDHANCFLMDRDFTPGDEPVKIALRDGRIVEFRKQLAGDLRFDRLGESVGFFRFDGSMAATMAGECARFESEGMSDAPHEEAIRNVVLRAPQLFGVEDVTGLPWIEIDFPEDVTRAADEILPAIRADHPDH
ncbi:phosphocholine cytidylyltransferase family protein [Elongatibacter sediminis]